MGKYKLYEEEFLVTVVVLALFVIAGYFSQTYDDFLISAIAGYNGFGMVLYVVGATVATIVPTMVFLPLLPLAVTLWGSFLAAVLSIIAWMLGAIVAFVLARRYGHPLAAHFVGKEKMEKIARLFPEHHLFWGVVFMRAVLPVDIVSYALGVLNLMRFWPYVVATLVGITPFAFAFSYLADAPARAQAAALVSGALILALAAPALNRRYHKVFGMRK